MSEEQRAECRAEGALDNFLADMARNMDNRGRSPEYVKAFWTRLNSYGKELFQ